MNYEQHKQQNKYFKRLQKENKELQGEKMVLSSIIRMNEIKLANYKCIIEHLINNGKLDNIINNKYNTDNLGED